MKGALAGFIGGLVGTWMMSECQAFWSRVADGAEPQSAGGRHDARDWQERNEGTNANELAANAVARATVGHDLTERELQIAAPLMHYAFGSAVSAFYGACAEGAPWVTAGNGAAFGTLVWAGADEAAMPALGLADPAEYPVESHLQSFVSHLVFGLTAEMVRRGVRRMLRDV
jgi:hypothetical protein